MRNEGIAIAGNILVDFVKEVDCYPEKGMLANIFDINMTVGGCVPNTAINLSMMKSDIPIKVIGKIGNDEVGRFVMDRLKKENIDISSISIAEGISTSTSDVISVRETGERTFFHHRGSNRLFSPADIDLDISSCV